MFLDFTKAFDTVDHQVLIKKRKKQKIALSLGCVRSQRLSIAFCINLSIIVKYVFFYKNSRQVVRWLFLFPKNTESTDLIEEYSHH